MGRHQRLDMASELLVMWLQESRRARHVACVGRVGHAFECWRLTAREQALLRKYLAECSLSTLRDSASAGISPCTVHHSDFERLYAEMAAYRWDALNTMAS